MHDAHLAFVPSPNGVVVVACVDPRRVGDDVFCDGLRAAVARRFGNRDVIVRCVLGDETFMLRGPSHLRRYAVDPEVDVLPKLPFGGVATAEAEAA